MNRNPTTSQSILMLLGRNTVAAFTFWLISFGLIQFGQRVGGGWPASEAGQLLGCVAGVVVALRMRARPVSYLVAGFAAFSASELAIHLSYGLRAAQGAATHFAVMGAGVIGVGLGALLAVDWRTGSVATASQGRNA